MLTLDYISNVVHGDLFFEKICSADIDWDEQLDRRDTGEFDENWTSNHEIVQNAEAPMFPDSEMDKLREFAFTKVFALTQNPDLASYVSDDFGLIGEAVRKNTVTPWIRRLIHDYMEGTFPTSSRVDENGTDE
ncbi:hypothetical protein E2R60_24745 [Paenibacillus dendritiformis]|uniref:hypothetical protein n=1 Tax=Paenibacillus dendritiformis TaxID=130049 RepID=UPI0010595A92|nr:hypothetical protein [Paenibacillus dendritiformis]TDL49231.1 hypothetical protein E2R60_24745 [Paenibacillus dendritiformis]